jgi:hypothetical protein
MARFGGKAIGVFGLCLAMLLGGCSLGTADDQRKASELAERRYPGLLQVVGARTLFPQTGGSEITFAIADDPDAVARLRIDSSKDDCDGRPCEHALTEAVDAARARATELRSMLSTFDGCGHQVVGIGPSGMDPWIIAAPTNATMTGIAEALGDCVRRWTQDRAARGIALPANAETLSVNLVEPTVAVGRPLPDPAMPTALRLIDRKLQAALSERPYLVATYKVRDRIADPAVASMRIVRPFAEEQEFGQKVRDAVGAWLRASNPAIVVTGYTGIWYLQPGTVDRLDGYVLFCDQPDRAGRCLGDHAVAVTVDPAGSPVGDIKVFRDVRTGDGSLRLPVW